jgi:pimeloyl-ACP methyl ester carboxylesterase
MGRFASKGLASKLKEASERVSPDVFRYRIGVVCATDFSARLQQVRVPILYLRASTDRIVPRSASRRIKRLVASARIVDIDGPHYLLQACPAAAVDAVTSFAKELGVLMI